MAEIKIGGKTQFYSIRPCWNYEVIITNSRYALVGYFITSYPTRAHGITVIYTYWSDLFNMYYFKKVKNDHRSIFSKVWLHSSVGRASHRYRRGHAFESCSKTH